MKHAIVALVGSVAISFLLGATLSSGLIVGFYTGRWWGEWEINYLMDIPAGGVVMSPRTGAQWVKTAGNALRFVRIPDPRRAQVVQLFPQTRQAKKPAESSQEELKKGGKKK